MELTPSPGEFPARTSVHRFWSAFRRLLRNSAGSTAIEYAILIGMIAVFVIGIASLGATLSSKQFETFATYFK